MGLWVIIAAAGLVVSATVPGMAADPPKKTKILLIGHDRDGHPYRTHEYMSTCNLLASCLRQTEGVETVVSNRWPQDPAVAADVNAIVVYAPNGSNILFDGPQRDAVKKLLSAGTGLAAVHWATGAQGEEFGRLWLENLGGWFHTDFSKLEHVEKHLTQVDPAHPICHGWKECDLFDEYYFNLRFAPGAKPLVTVEFEGKPNVVAWTYERPDSQGGRSFGFDGGHYHKNFGDDRFRQLVINGILWTARREIPAEGSPAKLTAKDLELPPPPDGAK